MLMCRFGWFDLHSLIHVLQLTNRPLNDRENHRWALRVIVSASLYNDI